MREGFLPVSFCIINIELNFCGAFWCDSKTKFGVNWALSLLWLSSHDQLEMFFVIHWDRFLDFIISFYGGNQSVSYIYIYIQEKDCKMEVFVKQDGGSTIFWYQKRWRRRYMTLTYSLMWGVVITVPLALFSSCSLPFVHIPTSSILSGFTITFCSFWTLNLQAPTLWTHI